ncbi:hypothetical protein L9F63_018958, partial [Diploptera punctata]
IYQDIVTCYYDKTAKECGTEEAKTLQKLIDQVITNSVKVNCNAAEMQMNNQTAELTSSNSLANHLAIYIPLAILLPIVLLIAAFYIRKQLSKKSQETIPKTQTKETQT